MDYKYEIKSNDYYYGTDTFVTGRFVEGAAIKGGTLRIPKTIARIKICGGGLTFIINDTMQFKMPTEEQCENLKKTFGIEVELVNED